jgi:hypothetical protein
VTKENTGRWEITVDGRPRTYSHNMQLAIEAAEYLKLKRPAAEVTVRDVEGDVRTVIIPPQQPQLRGQRPTAAGLLNMQIGPHHVDPETARVRRTPAHLMVTGLVLIFVALGFIWLTW